MRGASAAWLGDGKRLHLQHGPIDLIIEADGSHDEARLAYAQACERFQTVLIELVDELPRLRCNCLSSGLGLKGVIAQRMEAAVQPFSRHRITPMAAVAGAVADEVLKAMTSGRSLMRAYVNNGGDIGLVLSEDRLFPGENRRFEVAMVARPDRPEVLGTIGLRPGDRVGGIATSGRHGRSHSLGIADSVTVLAVNAASADAAATLIANAVDLPDHPGVQRVPARDLNPASDLGERLVTVGVPPLDDSETAAALDRGVAFAESLICGKGPIKAAALCLGDQQRLIGDLPAWQSAEVSRITTKVSPSLMAANHPPSAGQVQDQAMGS